MAFGTALRCGVYALGTELVSMLAARIPNLSVYFGHVRPRETFWYLTGTPELLRLAAERFEVHSHARGES